MLNKYDDQVNFRIRQRRMHLGDSLRNRYKPENNRVKKLRFRFNKINIILISVIILAICGLSINHLHSIKQTPASMNNMIAPFPTLQPTNNQVANDAKKSTDEYYLIDTANNHWVYTGAALSVDIKKIHDDILKIWYYVSDIEIKDPTAIRSGISDEVDPSKHRAMPGDMALKYKAIFSTNADLFVARKTGVIIRNGKLWRNNPSEPILAFYSNGDMKVFDPTEKSAQQLLDEGVTNTFAFGPILIRDGTIDHAVLKKNSLRPPNPRTGIGLVEKNHFISVVVEGRQPGYSEGITLDDFATLFQSLGCKTAYNLDGGQSSAVMFMGKPLNTHANDMNGTKWNTYRNMSEILIFGTSQLIPTSQDSYGTIPQSTITGN